MNAVKLLSTYAYNLGITGLTLPKKRCLSEIANTDIIYGLNQMTLTINKNRKVSLKTTSQQNLFTLQNKRWCSYNLFAKYGRLAT